MSKLVFRKKIAYLMLLLLMGTTMSACSGETSANSNSGGSEITGNSANGGFANNGAGGNISSGDNSDISSSTSDISPANQSGTDQNSSDQGSSDQGSSNQGGSDQNGSNQGGSDQDGSNHSGQGSASVTPKPVTGARSNEIRVLNPIASGSMLKENTAATLDYSNSSEGYVCVRYNGSVSKIKLRITGPDSIVYTYDLRTKDFEVFPLTGGNGTYSVAVYENVRGTEYSTAFYETINVSVSNELSPFLYPNQYVNFNSSSKTVAKAAEIVTMADSDLDAISLVYNYIISNISYDYAKAENPPTGYVPSVDDILASGTGICLDYAAVMCTMLRSQGIPARLEIGYASDAYHAWLSVYVKDIGWINGIVEFTGNKWTLMDPTFGANTDETTLKKFIGNGSNYTLQKIY